jgi:hypothetical protein
MNLAVRRQACHNVGIDEPISLELDGTVWTGTDDERTYPDPAPIDAEYNRLMAELPHAIVEANRLLDYEKTSDPVYFKWQRGDGTQEEWLAAVAKVKENNPYPPAP